MVKRLGIADDFEITKIWLIESLLLEFGIRLKKSPLELAWVQPLLVV